MNGHYVAVSTTATPVESSSNQKEIISDWWPVITTVVMVSIAAGIFRNKMVTLEEKVESIEKDIEEKEKSEPENRRLFKEEMLRAIKGDIAQSASDICHGFELFAVEQRQNIKDLQKGLEARNNTVNRMFNKIDTLEKEQLNLKYQRGNVPSTPPNYD